MKRCIRLVLVATLAIAACGGPPPTRLDRLYSGLDESLPRIDPAILAGRRVLVDPGHGGVFRGTVGRDSLEESSVNLGVSLYLWGLLTEAGAEVYLTRSIDRDFLDEADSSLARDLQARVDLADSLEPDIFVSIHHNAQPQRDPDHNYVETYYKAGDPASLDLAFAIHRHLMRNLGIEAGSVRQGNYYVLRENGDNPSVLGESSYLTHPPVEEKIKLSDTQRLEAEAYFLGILDYFSRGIPRIDRDIGPDSLLHEVPRLNFAVGDDGGFGIDPDGIELRIDGVVVHPRVETRTKGSDESVAYPSRVRFDMPADAANGAYEVALTVRNLGGNTSPVRTTRFIIDHPATSAVFDPSPATLPRTGAGEVHMRVRLLDRRGLPVADGKPVDAKVGREQIRGFTHDGVFEFPVAYGSGAAPAVSVRCDGRTFESRMTRGDGAGPGWKSVHVLDRTSNVSVTGAGVDGARAQPDASSPGRYYIERDRSFTLYAPGYVPRFYTTLPGDTIRMTPWFGGVLLGRRFVLDPEAGRDADVGSGPLGLSASWVNLRVARYLAGFLRDAGAAVMLTRDNEEVPTPEDVARRTNTWGADRYIEIRHRALPQDSVMATRIYHFPGSANGARMAADVGDVLGRRLPWPVRPPAEQVTYPLQQTACPAIVIAYPSIGNRGEELRLDTSRYLREQAYATFVGILEHFASPDSAALAVRVDAFDAERWLVVVDDTWTLMPDGSGRVLFEALAGGEHAVRATSGGRSLSTTVSAGADTAFVTLTP